MLKFKIDDDEEMRAGVEQVTEHSDEETPQARPTNLHKVQSVPVEQHTIDLMDLTDNTPGNEEMKEEDNDHITPEKNTNINISLGKATQAVPVSDVRANEEESTKETAPSVPLKMENSKSIVAQGGGSSTNKGGNQVALFG